MIQWNICFYEGREMVLNVFKGAIFPLALVEDTDLKLLTPKQMLQKLTIAIALVKAGNTSENCQMIYYLYQANEITKKVCDNITVLN